MIARAESVTLREASPADLQRWDELVRGFANHRVTHTRAWIQALTASGYGTPIHLLFEKDREVVGCLPGLVSSVARWRIFGSPRSGWQTVSMGPAYDPARLTTAEMMSAAVPFLEQRHGVAHIELMHAELDPDAMRAQGFIGEPVATCRAPLFPGDSARAFRRLKDSARRNVRRAERLGLEVRFEHDERFVDEHYAQLREVYLHGGYVVPFSRQRLRECFQHLRATGNLLPVSVYLPGGRVCIATGTFLLEGRELSLWMWAHRLHYRWYRPTELMTWTVMQRAMEAGCDTFDFMGRGEFKMRLGAELDLSKWRWMRSRPRWLGAARNLARTGYRWQQAARGRAMRLSRSASASRRLRGGSEREPTACVLGDIDLVRALGLAGIRPVVVAPPGDAALYSRFTRGALPWHDPATSPAKLTEELIAFGQGEPEPPVLFYDDDAGLLFLSRHRTRLAQAFRFVLPESELVEALVDKGRFQELASRLELPVPPASAHDPAREAPPAMPACGYPCILKPLTRRPAHWRSIAGERKALPIDSEQALRGLWPTLAAAGIPVLLQGRIAGPESRIESYHVYVDDAACLVAEFTGRKIRTLPLECGDSSALEITDQEDVAELGREVVKRLRLRGVAKLDFKRDADGHLFLLEVNPRFTLWHHLGARAGVNIPALVYNDLLGRHRPRVSRARAGVRWCKVWTDRSAARDDGLSLLRWLPWALGCEAKRALAWDDPWPLLGAGLWRWLVKPRRAAPAAARPLLDARGVPPCA